MRLLPRRRTTSRIIGIITTGITSNTDLGRSLPRTSRRPPAAGGAGGTIAPL